MFKSDFRVVAEYFTQMRKNKKFEPTDMVIEHVDAVLNIQANLQISLEDVLKVLGKNMEDYEKALNIVTKSMDKDEDVDENEKQEN